MEGETISIPSVFIKNKIINTVSDLENQSSVTFWNPMFNLQKEYEKMGLNFWGHWDQMLSLGASWAMDLHPEGQQATPEQGYLAIFLPSPIPMFHSLMVTLIAWRKFTQHYLKYILSRQPVWNNPLRERFSVYHFIFCTLP